MKSSALWFLLMASFFLSLACKKQELIVPQKPADDNQITINDSINPGFLLTVIVEGIKEISGQINIALYENADDFNNPDKALLLEFFPVTDKEQTIEIPNLLPGRYAFAVFHDKNGNFILDQNLLGIPKEGFAFSNNAFGTFGPPSWNVTAFDFNEETENTHRVKLKHY